MDILDGVTAELFVVPPVGAGGKATFDGDGLVRVADNITRGWFQGKLVITEGELLPATFAKAPAWLEFATGQGLAGVLAEAETFLARLASESLAIAARYPEVQAGAGETANKLGERADLARVARVRFAQSAPVTPLRAVMADYSSAYTNLNVARDQVPANPAAVEEARKQAARQYDLVTQVNTAARDGLDALAAAARRLAGQLAAVPPAKLTPAQRRTAAEYDAIIAALKGAWAFPVPTIATPAPLPKTRGASVFNRAFRAIRKIGGKR